MRNPILIPTAAGLLIVSAVAVNSGGFFTMSATQSSRELEKTDTASPVPTDAKLQKATFGSGCFWCTEAVFQQLKGVHSVVSGYSGGHVNNPSYDAVCMGRTGHAEVVQITYDPEVISFAELLEVFWQTHDPTTLNR